MPYLCLPPLRLDEKTIPRPPIIIQERYGENYRERSYAEFIADMSGRLGGLLCLGQANQNRSNGRH